MRKLIWICLLFPFFPIQAKENILVNADPEFALRYSVMNKGELSSYKNGRVAFFEKGAAYTAVLNENLEKTDVKPAPELDGLGIEGHFAYDPSLNKIYFSKGGELFSSVWKNGRWEAPQPVVIARIKMERKTLPGSSIAYSGWRYKPDDIKVQGQGIYNPVLSSDGKKLYYSADLPGTYGGLDIWYSTLEKNGTWSVPVNLGENVNSASDENIPLLQGDTSIFFASVTPRPEGMADSDSRLTSGKSSFSTKNERNMFFVPLNFDQKSSPIAALLTPKKPVEIKPEPKPEPISEPVIEPVIEPVTKPVIEPAPVPVNSNESSSRVYLKDAGTYVFLFDYDNDNLIGSYREEIGILLDFINHYKDSKFLIVGYTDERGSEQYNMALSEKRAKKIYQLFVEKGISKERLQYTGKGKADPVFKDAKTEDEHQKNRRVEIRKMD